jgi:hypothetical protein
MIKDSIVFIDEGNKFVGSKEFAKSIKNSDNYYVIVSRESFEMLPYSIREIYGLKESGSYSNIKQTYNESYYSVLSYYSYSSFVIYTISFILYYVLIPLLFKDGKSIAKFCLGYGVFTKDRKYVKNNIVVLRSVLQYISYFFFVTLIPFLHIGISCFQMPLLMFDGYILSMIIPFLFSLLLSIISFIFIATSAHYQSLHEMCSHTIVGKIITKPVNEKGDNTNGK